MADEDTKVVDATFVRQDFYVDPPAKGASVEVWNAWLKQDANKARAAKAAFTKSLKQEVIPDGAATIGMRKVNGRWQQCQGHVALSGSAEDNTLAFEPSCDATQEMALVAARLEATRHKRGKPNGHRNARKRRNQRARKAAAKAKG